MIVISGALVLVALILLIVGLVSTALSFVYASIAVSAVSFVFLAVGILQRRGEQPPLVEPTFPATPGPGDPEGITAILPSAPAAGDPAASDPASGVDLLTGTVLVVQGRPRYHVAGCRYLSGRDAQAIAVDAARADGYTACGICKPDEALTRTPGVEPEAAAALRAEEPAVTTTAPVRRTAKAAPSQATPSRVGAAAKPAVAADRKPAAKKVTGKGVAPAPAAARMPAAAPAPRRGAVLVIGDRGKFHLSECRYVRGVAEAQQLTRAQATRQGYEACGVCKP